MQNFCEMNSLNFEYEFIFFLSPVEAPVVYVDINDMPSTDLTELEREKFRGVCLVFTRLLASPMYA